MSVAEQAVVRRLVDRVAVVTGGASGIGLATARRFAAEQQNIASMEGVVEIGRAGLRGQQDQPRMLLPPPALERVEARVTHERDLIEIIHPRASEVPVRDRKAGRLDDVRLDVQAGAQAKNRASVLGDVGLEKRDTHSESAGHCERGVDRNVMDRPA